MIAPIEPAESSISLDDPSLYYSRELSWLEFNDRVLEEASDPRNPLLERVKFTAIFSTNLDEYFMIRVAPLKQQIEAEVHKRSVDGRLPEEQLAAISARLRLSLDRFTHLLRDELWPALAREGIRVRRYDELDARVRIELERTFNERVFPVLTPLAVDQTLRWRWLDFCFGRVCSSRGVLKPVRLKNMLSHPMLFHTVPHRHSSPQAHNSRCWRATPAPPAGITPFA